MTKEEAITELSVLYERFDIGMGWRDGNYTEALDMAIEALSAESETLSHEEAWKQIDGDLISRADAIDAVCKDCIERYAEEKECNAICSTRELLESLPSADRPSGEWLDYDGKPMEKYAQYSGHCSVCGEWSEYLTDYCGNCGAYMADKGVE